MSVFYVFQGETYKHERDGGYVWSPQTAKNGSKNAGYTTMTYIRKNDFILHNRNGKIVAISVARTDCYEAAQPSELIAANTTVQWNNDGYRIDCDYYEFDTPLRTYLHTGWLAGHYQKDSAFTTVGRGKQQYMCTLADEHAVYLLNEAIRIQKDSRVIKILKAALSDIVDDKESEYDAVEMEEINERVDSDKTRPKPEWAGIKAPQELTVAATGNREKPKRNNQIAADALHRADYLCEVDPSHRTFLRKNDIPYTEPHHLIPLSRYRDFNYSLDVMENLVSLCSHCHNLLHYGRMVDKRPVLEKLYNERIEALRKCGLDLTLEQLLDYYK